MKYFSSFSSATAYNSSKSSLLRPHVSLIEADNNVEYIPLAATENDYLTFIALESGKFNFSNSSGLQYSTDQDKTWRNIPLEGISVEAGDSVYWKGTLTPQMYQGVGTFSSTCKYNAEGNVMSLLYGDNFTRVTSLSSVFAFYNLFNNNNKLVNAKNLYLLATTLTEACYGNMFNGCTSLVTAPKLPATSLADYCYTYMFANCTSLVKAPDLNATNAVSGCYEYMFQNCTSLNYIYNMAITGLNNIASNMTDGVPLEGGTYYVSSLIYNEETHTTTMPGIPTDWTIVPV